MDRKAYSIVETARITGVGTTAVKQAIRRGALEARKLNRRTIVTNEAITAWITGLPKIKPSESTSDSPTTDRARS
jgi:hypothetical protein